MKENLVEFPVIIAIQFHPQVEIIVKGYIIHCLSYFLQIYTWYEQCLCTLQAFLYTV